jgi:hypothetical protein
MRMRLLVLLLSLVALGVAVAACGGGYDASPEAAAAADVVEGAPVLEDYRGAPLAIAFFHPF